MIHRLDELNKTVTLNEEEYEELVSDSKFLQALRNAGVDNWEGYEFAIDEFNEGEE